MTEKNLEYAKNLFNAIIQDRTALEIITQLEIEAGKAPKKAHITSEGGYSIGFLIDERMVRELRQQIARRLDMQEKEFVNL